MSERRGDRRAALTFEPARDVLGAVLARLNVDAYRRAVVLHLDPVRAQVGRAGVGVDGDDGAAGPYVPPAVKLVPDGRGEIEEVDVVFGQLVREHRSGTDLARRVCHGAGRPRGRTAAQRLDQLCVAKARSQPERHAHQRRARQARSENPAARPVSGYVLEQQGARPAATVVELAGSADLKVGASTGHALELARLLGGRDPLTEVEDRHVTALLACFGGPEPVGVDSRNVGADRIQVDRSFHSGPPLCNFAARARTSGGTGAAGRSRRM